MLVGRVHVVVEVVLGVAAGSVARRGSRQPAFSTKGNPKFVTDSRPLERFSISVVG